MNRLERISAILIKLQSKPVVTAQQIADEFEVSLRTIYRDIRALEEAGIPIVSSAGVGYSLVEGYKLPPLMFTTEEAIAFLMAEKLIRKDTDKGSYDHFQSGMNKIRAVLRTVEKDLLATADDYIIVEDSNCKRPKPPNVIQPILQCIIKKQEVIIEYYSNHSQEVNKRTIEPIGISYLKDSWYLAAYCLLRNDYRTFKINRIKEVVPTTKVFERTHPDLNTLVTTLYKDEFSHNVVIKLKKEVRHRIEDNMFFFGLYNEEDAGDCVIQHYATYSLHYFIRWYITFADHATIIEPTELKDILRGIVSRIKI